jgi:hypothetical protein
MSTGHATRNPHPAFISRRGHAGRGLHSIPPIAGMALGRVRGSAARLSEAEAGSSEARRKGRPRPPADPRRRPGPPGRRRHLRYRRRCSWRPLLGATPRLGSSPTRDHSPGAMKRGARPAMGHEGHHPPRITPRLTGADSPPKREAPSGPRLVAGRDGSSPREPLIPGAEPMSSARDRSRRGRRGARPDRPEEIRGTTAVASRHGSSPPVPEERSTHAFPGDASGMCRMTESMAGCQGSRPQSAENGCKG